MLPSAPVGTSVDTDAHADIDTAADDLAADPEAVSTFATDADIAGVAGVAAAAEWIPARGETFAEIDAGS